MGKKWKTIGNLNKSNIQTQQTLTLLLTNYNICYSSMISNTNIITYYSIAKAKKKMYFPFLVVFFLFLKIIKMQRNTWTHVVLLAAVNENQIKMRKILWGNGIYVKKCVIIGMGVNKYKLV